MSCRHANIAERFKVPQSLPDGCSPGGCTHSHPAEGRYCYQYGLHYISCAERQPELDHVRRHPAPAEDVMVEGTGNKASAAVRLLGQVHTGNLQYLACLLDSENLKPKNADPQHCSPGGPVVWTNISKDEDQDLQGSPSLRRGLYLWRQSQRAHSQFQWDTPPFSPGTKTFLHIKGYGWESDAGQIYSPVFPWQYAPGHAGPGTSH